MIVQIAVWGAFGLIAFGVLTMIVSGVRSLTQGKQDLKRIAIMAIPLVIFGITFVIVKDAELPYATAGVMTTVVMMGIMGVSVVITGIRGTFKF